MDLSKNRERIAKYQNCISAGGSHTVGLKTDGTVVATGNNDYGQCNTDSWRDIVAIYGSCSDIFGLKKDGTFVLTAWDDDNYYDQFNRFWGSVAIADDGQLIVGLKENGTVVTVGDNRFFACNIESWRDIVAIANSACHTVGLKKDGTVVAVGDNRDGECNTDSWLGIGPVPEEKRRAMEEEGKCRLEQSDKWVSQGICKYCGGKLGGLFTNKCKSCGKVN